MGKSTTPKPQRLDQAAELQEKIDALGERVAELKDCLKSAKSEIEVLRAEQRRIIRGDPGLPLIEEIDRATGEIL